MVQRSAAFGNRSLLVSSEGRWTTRGVAPQCAGGRVAVWMSCRSCSTGSVHCDAAMGNGCPAACACGTVSIVCVPAELRQQEVPGVWVAIPASGVRGIFERQSVASCTGVKAVDRPSSGRGVEWVRAFQALKCLETVVRPAGGKAGRMRARSQPSTRGFAEPQHRRRRANSSAWGRGSGPCRST
jgi:hypothetical protein